MNLELDGKTVLLTGASKGIGYAAARLFAQEGAIVVLAARREDELNAARDEIARETGATVEAVPADVTLQEDLDRLAAHMGDCFGRVDVLVNNAGTSSASRFEDMTNEQVEEDFTLKVMGAIYCTRHALPHLKATQGVICNTTTPGGKAPGPGSQPTALSRASGISLTKTWSKEFAADGVRVNTVCVGLLKSRQHRLRWEKAKEKNPDLTLEDMYERMGQTVPMLRVGEASEAGDVIAFMCSAGASYVTGSAINVDGGAAPVV